MKCPKCRKEIPNDSVFCNYCGSSIDIPDGFMVCRLCGKYIPNDSEFCQYCGTVIEKQQEDKQNKDSIIKQRTSLNKKAAPGRKKIGLIALGIVVIVAIVLLIIFLGQNNKNSTFVNNESSVSESAGYLVTLRSAGNGNTFDITAYYDSPMPKVDAPSRDGYIFKGYFSSTNGTGIQYYDANMESTKNWDKRQGGTLYAYWVEKDSHIVATTEQPITKDAAIESSSSELIPAVIANGTILVRPQSERVAPLEIKTQEGEDYYIYLKSVSRPENDMAFYVVGGETVNIDQTVDKPVSRSACSARRVFCQYCHYWIIVDKKCQP